MLITHRIRTTFNAEAAQLHRRLGIHRRLDRWSTGVCHPTLWHDTGDGGDRTSGHEIRRRLANHLAHLCVHSPHRRIQHLLHPTPPARRRHHPICAYLRLLRLLDRVLGHGRPRTSVAGVHQFLQRRRLANNWTQLHDWPDITNLVFHRTRCWGSYE